MIAAAKHYATQKDVCERVVGHPVKPSALILAPTRELCLQISKVTESILSNPIFTQLSTISHFCEIGK